MTSTCSESCMDVEMARLWAPWRSRFLTQRSRRRCFLCQAKSSHADRAHHVVARDRQAFALLNRYPYNNGHLLVAPRRHVAGVEQLTAGEWEAMRRLSQRLMTRLNRTLRPQGYNVGMNLGRVAGAGVPGHLHLHLVPRWQGDTNFMPVVGATKVISQSLNELYTLLRLD